MIRIERNPSRNQLLVFGLLWLVFFCFFGTASWWKDGIQWKAVFFWAIALIIPVAGSIWPSVLRKVYVAASFITLPVGIIISSLVLIVIYYGVVTPIGLVLRICGYDPMERKFNRTVKTYWTARKPEVETERYFKQF